MDVQERLRIIHHLPVAGAQGTEEYILFRRVIEEYSSWGQMFICSSAYELGRIQGVQEERARRRTGKRKR